MERLFRIAFWAAALLTFTMAVLPHPPEVHVWDKLQHMAAFFVIMALGRAGYPRLASIKLLLGLIAFGGFIELVQMLPFVHRDGELSDWLADLAGAVVALALFSVAVRFRTARAD